MPPGHVRQAVTAQICSLTSLFTVHCRNKLQGSHAHGLSAPATSVAKVDSSFLQGQGLGGGAGAVQLHVGMIQLSHQQAAKVCRPHMSGKDRSVPTQ